MKKYNSRATISMDSKKKNLLKQKGYVLQDLFDVTLNSILDIQDDSDLEVQEKIQVKQKQKDVLNAEIGLLESELHSSDKKYQVKIEGRLVNERINEYQDFGILSENKIQELADEKNVSVASVRNRILEVLNS